MKVDLKDVHWADEMVVLLVACLAGNLVAKLVASSVAD